MPRTEGWMSEIRCHVKFWIREKNSVGTVFQQKFNSLAEGFKSLRCFLEIEVGIAIQKFLYTLSFILRVRCLLGCLVSL